MGLLNFWKSSSDEKASFRRIYKGEVPYLKDDELAQPKQPPKRNLNEEDDDEAVERRPSKIRRESFTPKPPQSRKASAAVTKAQPVQGSSQSEKFPNNLIISSRYNIWNFIPKNLFEQFRRIVNFYFLMIALVQSIIDSPVHPLSAILPFVFVLVVTAIKQGYEDYCRHKSDDQLNNLRVKLIQDGTTKEIKSRDIRVGDLLKLEAEDQVPTDLLLIGSSGEFLRCQINTANLDGETNLKLRYCPSGLPHFKSVEDLNLLHAIVECEQPNPDLYDFSGSLLIPVSKLREMQNMSTSKNLDSEAHDNNNEGASSKNDHYTDLMSGVVSQGATDFLSIPLSMDNLLLRGTTLKSTDYIFGLVVYTGRDTRLSRNSENSQSKFSTVEKAVNYYLIFFIGLFIFLIAFCSIMHFTVNFYPGAEGDDGPWYTHYFKETDGVIDTLNMIASFIPLFHYIIPISLYVTIELQKFSGSLFFVWDQDMFDQEGKGPLCNTSDLNEELGQIEYLFSDKTGTLTQNEMEFRHCSINATRYEYKADNKLYLTYDKERSEELGGNEKSEAVLDEKALGFFRTLALCHSVQVVPARRASTVATSSGTHDLGGGGGMEYQASSPDEKALLEACEKLGIRYCGEKEDVLTLDVQGQHETYKRLMHLEFDADRKCMSVIVENGKGEIWLLTKGAESNIIPKCDEGPTQQTLDHVMDYALLGLRTLVVAERRLTKEEFETFNQDLRAARRLIRNRQESVRQVYTSVETHLTLIGATGVEDQLQDLVPETLQAFAAAGIRVWMLTGDKLETGVNVALSSGLITSSTKQYVVNNPSKPGEIYNRLKEISGEMNTSSSSDDNTCLVIDGDSLAIATKTCPDLLRDVSMKAFRVVCCRMTPLQKAQVVQMVKNSPDQPTCCAVGDGANDCAMILAAHVGIGILGKEGRQAARCADFALPKFEHLRKAILVHGHWFYVRLATLANYFFYKNVVFVLPAFYYSISSNFSTQALFGGLFLMLYNLFFASVPILCYGILEQPIPAQVLMDNPQLYKRNRKNSSMTVRSFMPWFIASLFHSAVVYYLPFFSWGNLAEMDNTVSFGVVVATGIVVTTNMKMGVETNYITWWYFACQVFSFLCYFAVLAIYMEADLSALGMNVGDNLHVLFTMYGSVCFWVLMVTVMATAIVPDIIYRSVRDSWRSAIQNHKQVKALVN